MEAFTADIMSNLYGNPHSASWPSQLSTTRIENIRLRLLSFFNADPTQFDLIFVANATAGVKLVVEGLRTLPKGFDFAYHQACHTSVIGARKEANRSTCLDDEETLDWPEAVSALLKGSHSEASATLVSYSAQSHMDGRRYPLSWSKGIRDKCPTTSSSVYTLLDAASYSATSPLDLGDADAAPDFTVLSLYKLFGFPDLGVLIVRRCSEAVFNHRRYFGGGTVDLVTCGREEWHATKSQFLHERLEDGTLPFHNIIALDSAMTVHQKLFESMAQVKRHTSWLSHRLRQGLHDLRHANGRPVCVLYPDFTKSYTPAGTGPVVAFNIKNLEGAWISLSEFEKLAVLNSIHVRTGGVCSPGGIASALGLEPWEMKENFSAGFRCGSENDIVSGKPTGVIRVSFGAMSSLSDVERFLMFMADFFVENPAHSMPTSQSPCKNPSKTASLRVKSLMIYPIKSCCGFTIPKGARWEVRAEGLAWDREWCLVHRGTRQALSQKRYPQMALLRPNLDLKKGVLRMDYAGPIKNAVTHITIPLSFDPSIFGPGYRQTSSRVCGDDIKSYAYISEEINGFFSAALGVDCVLSRFPAGGRASGGRSSKARIQTYQQKISRMRLPGAFPDVPSPPDSDSEQQQHTGEGRILLANESPILLINSSSVDALNHDIADRGGTAVSDATFRANIVVEDSIEGSGPKPFSEDTWSTMRIGACDFKLLGACRRCQMVCVDQVTGERRQEPFSTLAKTRRFDGKVYFGAHMRHDPQGEKMTEETQYPTIQVGDQVSVD